jgi:hypothetical protein
MSIIWKNKMRIGQSGQRGMQCNNETLNIKTGAPWVMAKNILNKSHASYTEIHGRDNLAPKPMKIFIMETKMENEALTRENHDTFTMTSRLLVTT